MGLLFKRESLKRYRDIARLLAKYGHRDLVVEAGLAETSDIDVEVPEGLQVSADPHELARDIERMGPTFIKLAQLVSTRSNLLPVAYIRALSRLQDRVEPFPYEEVAEIVSTELGVRISKAFLEFDRKPIGSASLGQVHRAVMRNGREVAVKVQRPGIRERILQDFEALEGAAEFLDRHTKLGKRYRFGEIIEELRKTLMHELDYRQEAQNLIELRHNLAGYDKIVIPDAIEDYTSTRVLTMEHIEGRKITELSPLQRMEIDGAELADQLFRAYLDQILVHGFFHADPHAGNVFITDDGRVALIDLGMIGRNTPQMQEQLLKLVLAISEGRAEQAASVAIEIAIDKENFKETPFRRRIGEIVMESQAGSVEELDIGQVILELSRAAAENDMRVPPELTMLGKTLLNLHEVGLALDPHYDPNAAIRAYASDLMQARVTRSISPGNVYQTLLEVKEFAENFPRRINRILDAISGNQLKFKMEVFDEELIDGAQKIANRITMGLILASLIVAAALIMRIPTAYQIAGYPALAIIFFLASALGGAALVISIAFYDKKPRRNTF